MTVHLSAISYIYQCILYTSTCAFINTMKLLRVNLILHSSLHEITITSAMPVAPLYIRNWKKKMNYIL